MDFFTVPTATFQVLFVLIVLAHDRRRIVHFNVTEHPTAEWTAQQMVEAIGDGKSPRYLIRDRDGVVVRENPARLSDPMGPGTRSSGPRLVSTPRGFERTPIAPGKPVMKVAGLHSAGISEPERDSATTMQPAGSRDVTRSTQESPQVCHPSASAHRLPDRDPVCRSVLDERGRGYTSR